MRNEVLSTITLSAMTAMIGMFTTEFLQQANAGEYSNHNNGTNGSHQHSRYNAQGSNNLYPSFFLFLKTAFR